MIPSVCNTVKTLLSWQVGFPFSNSMIKRKPVPEVRARSFWVTPIDFRVCLTSSPICFGVSFMDAFYIPVQEHYEGFGEKVNKNS